MENPDPALIEQYAPTAGTLLVLDAPPNIHIGIDNMLWKVGPKFKGVNLIPRGIHYFYWGAGDSDQFDTHRMGIFISISRDREVVALRWKVDTELFEFIEEEERSRLEEGVHNFHFRNNLGPYPLSQAKQWSETTAFISKKDIDRIQPVSRLVGSSSRPLEYDMDVINRARRLNLPKPAMPQALAQEDPQAAAGDNLLETFAEDRAADTLFFCDIPANPSKTAGGALSGADLTAMLMDTSAQLEQIASTLNPTTSTKDDTSLRMLHAVLAEMQVAFICFLLGQNYDAMVHWLKLLRLVANAERLASSTPDFFSDAIRVVYSHLSQFPDDLLTDPVLEGSSISREVVNLVEICADSGNSKLEGRLSRLRSLLKDKFGLEVEGEGAWAALGEGYGPVILAEEELGSAWLQDGS